MPLVEDLRTGTNRLGLWTIDGAEKTFEHQFPEIAAQLAVRHPRTQLQRYAARMLLAEMLGSMPNLDKDSNGRPLLPEHPYQVSISHTDGYAAVLLGNGPLGVDVQHFKPNVLKVRDRFLDDNELELAKDLETTTLLWAAKEAIYKYNALPGLDFKHPITVHAIEDGVLPCSFIYQEHQKELTLAWRQLDGAMLVWTR